MVVALALLAVSCQEEPARLHPGPCFAEWTVYKAVSLGPWRLRLPVSEGDARRMTFTYDEQGRLARVDDDYDQDGALEHRIDLVRDTQGRVIAQYFDRGADGVIEVSAAFTYGAYDTAEAVIDTLDEGTGELQRRVEVGGAPMGGIWERCYGQCAYDGAGNLLEDRDPAGGDVIRYFHECWGP